MSAYDVELERTDEKAKSPYLTKKDIARLMLGIAIAMVLLYPVYVLLMGNAKKKMCSANFGQMYKAISLYAAENNDRLPPVYVTSETDAPLVEKNGAYTWVSLVDGFAKDPSVFTCPAAESGSGTKVYSSIKGSINLTYGMYAPLGGEPLDQIDDPHQSVLLAETNNMGAENTYDPLTFKDKSGQVVPYDGFIIGFDDSNSLPTAKTKKITRLAFPETANGDFKPKGLGRHRDGIHFVTADGRLKTRPPTAANYLDETGQVSPLWRLSKTRKFRN